MKAKEFSISALDDLEVELICAVDLLGAVQYAISENATEKASGYADALYALKLYLARLGDELGDLVCLGRAAGL